MGQICHAHCPPGGGGHVAAAGAAAAGAAMSAIAAVIGDIVLAAGIVMAVLVVTGTWLLIHLLRRDRGTVSSRDAIIALTMPQRAALAPVHQVISGAYVITDVREVHEGARITAVREDGAR